MESFPSNYQIIKFDGSLCTVMQNKYSEKGLNIGKKSLLTQYLLQNQKDLDLQLISHFLVPVI